MSGESDATDAPDPTLLPAGAAPASAHRKSRWLPTPGTWKYHLMLGAIGILILGPLGGVSASFMNFSIGFFVGGQVLAGILGSAVTFGYGPDGKHGANFMQTTAASVAGLSGMAVLVQAMVWLGLPEPPMWQMVIYLLCIGMFGVGVGMLYTPLLVDRLKLTYPSGLAVANILRALTDKRLLRRSIATLGGGTLAGVVGGVASLKVAILETIGVSFSTIGAGMIVGARIGIPAIIGGIISSLLQPYFVSIGWLHEDEPFRKITFIIALGMIMGAALVDIAIIFYKAVARVRAVRREGAGSAGAIEPEAWKRTNTTRLIIWCAVWGAGVVATGTVVLKADPLFLVFAVGLVFVFVLVNGISQGISDQNPISSAFVVSVLLMGLLGLESPGVGLLAAAIVFVSVSVACDMQQDRSTGWRLGTNRNVQFRYQVAGVAMGALLAVLFAKVFMSAYPVLAYNQAQDSVEAQAIDRGATPEEAKAEADGARAAAVAEYASGLREVATAAALSGGADSVKAPCATETARARAALALDKRMSSDELELARKDIGELDPDEKDAVRACERGGLAAALEGASADREGWQSAMTFKMAGAIKNLTHPKKHTFIALWIGVGIGLGTEILRKLLKAWKTYIAFVKSGAFGYSVDFVIDCAILPSPYASSFGGFVGLPTSLWFGGGGALGSFLNWWQKAGKRPSKDTDLAGEALPEDMSTVSLIGGGLIAGDSLAALGFGITVLLSKLT